MGIRSITTGILAMVAGGQVWMSPRAGRVENEMGSMPVRLSEYHIFRGAPSDLLPSVGFTVYTLANTLFTDYAEKQRLIRLPSGGKLHLTGEGLPVFAEGTMLVKTFYYYHDKQDTTRGKRLVETRVMRLSKGGWEWGAYLWNADGTEALLTNTSSTIKIDWRDVRGIARSIRYVAPSHKDCATCHATRGAGGEFLPIGLTGRNLRLGEAFVPSMPVWQDSTFALEQRVRAYLDVNCAHCHNPDGYCARSGLDLRWGAPLPEGKVFRKMVKLMRTGRMPLIGTTIVHEEGVALLEEYLK